MGASIKKTGVILADGTGIGENLILNGNAVEFNGTYVSGATYHWKNWATSSLREIVYKDGKWWFHCKSPASTTYGGFHQDGTDVAIKPNTNYTVSAIWFASSECNCRFWFHMRSTEGGGNISQPSTNLTVTPTPTRFTFTFNSGSNATYTINRFNLMMGPAATTEGIDVYFTDVKLEEGSIATPWIPNEADELYVGKPGFIEGSEIASIGDDYIVGDEFYEI